MPKRAGRDRAEAVGDRARRRAPAMNEANPNAVSLTPRTLMPRRPPARSLERTASIALAERRAPQAGDHHRRRRRPRATQRKPNTGLGGMRAVDPGSSRSARGRCRTGAARHGRRRPPAADGRVGEHEVLERDGAGERHDGEVDAPDAQRATRPSRRPNSGGDDAHRCSGATGKSMPPPGRQVGDREARDGRRARPG